MNQTTNQTQTLATAEALLSALATSSEITGEAREAVTEARTIINYAIGALVSIADSLASEYVDCLTPAYYSGVITDRVGYVRAADGKIVEVEA
jgi:hypothetical protein